MRSYPGDLTPVVLAFAGALVLMVVISRLFSWYRLRALRLCLLTGCVFRANRTRVSADAEHPFRRKANGHFDAEQPGRRGGVDGGYVDWSWSAVVTSRVA